MIVSSLINNITLIVSLSILYSLIIRKWDYESRTNRIMSGFLFGAVAIVGMMNPLVFSPGLIFDGRSIIISIAGLFGGWIAALISALMSIIYRVWLGGPGAVMGVAVSVCSAAIGITYHYIRRRRPDLTKPLHLLGFGIVVHIFMLAMTMTLPANIRFVVLANIALPVISIYPLGTLLVCLVLLDQESRVRAEKSLRESEEKHRLVVENAREAIIITQEGRIVFLNRMTAEISGFPEDELTASPFTDFIHPDDKQMVLDNHLKRMKGDELPPVYNFRIIRKDKSVKWVEINSTLINWQGRPSILSFLGDITDRKESEESLRKSETRIVQAQNIAHLGSWEIDLINRKMWGSEEAFRIYGLDYPGRDAAYLTLADAQKMVHEEDRLEMDKALKELLRENKRYDREFRIIRTGDAAIRIIHSQASVLFDSAGAPQKIVGVIQDITDRKQAEDALRQSEERFRAIFNSSFQFTGLMMPDGTMIEANQTALDFAGIKMEDVKGRPFWEIRWWQGDENRVERLKDAVRRAAGGEFIRYETELQGAGETKAIIDFSLKPVYGKSNEITLLIPEGRDITVIKRAEEERKEFAERLQRAEKMEVLGRLSGGVAHDLNNVLGVMVGYSELLQEKLPDDSPLKRYADNIHQSTVRGAAIIQDLLTLARRGVTVAEVVDLNKLVLNYFKTLEFEKLRADHPGVKIDSSLAGGLLNIKGSPVHLGKTLMNLVSNAVESITGLGEVMVRTENRYLDRPLLGYDQMQEGDYAVLTVTDTGGGIPAKDIGKIFEPFYTKKAMGRSGTGLGLAIVWGVVKDHNGYIDVQSREGEGTVFSLYFPVTREEPMKEGIAVSLETYKGRGEAILVVDDIEAQRELAAAMLGRLGYRVDVVSSGEAAIDYLKTRQVDLVVLDMIMEPGMDGLETYGKILEHNPRQRAVIVSGYAETGRVRKAQEMGAGQFVKKPYIMEKIGMAIREELDRK